MYLPNNMIIEYKNVYCDLLFDIHFANDAMNFPKGKLYSKYFNMIWTMKQSGLLSKMPNQVFKTYMSQCG